MNWSSIQTGLRAAIAPFLIAGALGTALAIGSGTCSSACERKRVFTRRRLRPDYAHEREHSNGNNGTGPAGRCADRIAYLLVSV
jgi:hypothetical protein